MIFICESKLVLLTLWKYVVPYFFKLVVLVKNNHVQKQPSTAVM